MWRSTITWIAIALLCGGCAVLEPLRSPGGDGADRLEAPSPDARALLHRAAEFAALGPGEQEQALARAARRYEADRTLPNVAGYAVLLAMTDPAQPAVTEVAGALREQLGRHPPDGTHNGLASLARFLLQIMNQHTRLQEQNTELQQKLEQLKAIEQRLRERDDPSNLPMTQ